MIRLIIAALALFVFLLSIRKWLHPLPKQTLMVAKEPPAPEPENPHEPGTKRLVKEWNVVTGKWDYVLEEWRVDGSYLSFDLTPSSYFWSERHTSADEYWANRTAEHFGLTIEDRS
jgi:hypothetical protein